MDVVLANDIKGCDDCPLYGNDCCGNWTSGSGGTPIEPPCCSWNGEEKIYKCMYSSREWDYSEEELEHIREVRERAENKRRAEHESQEKERLWKLVKSLTPYGLSKTKRAYGGLNWYCNRCKRWVHTDAEHYHDGIGEAVCYKCGITMVHCGSLEDD